MSPTIGGQDTRTTGQPSQDRICSAAETFAPLKIMVIPVLMLTMGLGSCRDRATVLTPPPTALGGTLNSRDAEHSPRLSYDGRYLVFSSDRRNQRQVYLYDVQRRQVIPLPGLNTPGTFISQPDISADGRYIVYISEQYGKPDVFLYDRQSFQSEALTREFKGEVRQPTISGNGRIVAFESNRTGEWNIEIIDRGNIAPSLPQNETPGDLPSPDEE